MYNAPRAASIIANEECTMYALDRDCFNAIVKDSSIRRRERFEEFMNKVSLFKDLDTYERNNLCDILETETFEGGESVIKEGEAGNKFYLIEKGDAEAYIGSRLVYKFTENDYFGELALLNNVPRAASVKASSEVLRVCTIDKDNFKRFLEPLRNTMLKQASRYTQ